MERGHAVPPMAGSSYFGDASPCVEATSMDVTYIPVKESAPRAGAGERLPEMSFRFIFGIIESLQVDS